MAIILNIHTAVESASVCIASDGEVRQMAKNDRQQDHAAWLHPALQQLLNDSKMKLKDLDAIAVTIGPGSYTGLRVGLATVKGLCFALEIPLLPINTLEMMAYATKDEEAELLCPLIDARRMEVFTAVYDKALKPLIEPKAMILDATSFDSILSKSRIIFSGNGSEKFKQVVTHPNALYSNTIATAVDMVQLSELRFKQKLFADVAYIEPLYLKDFYSVAR